MPGTTKRRIKVPATGSTVVSATAGSIITFDLDLGLRYHDIDIVFSDGANAQTLTTVLGDIIVLRNDVAERTHTALELDHLNGVNGTQYLCANKTSGTSGTDREQTMTIYLDEPWRKNIVQSDQLAWSVDAPNGFRTFQVKITVAVALSATASITLFANVDAPLAPPKGGQPVKKVYRTGVTASGMANEFNNSNFPSSRGAYQAIYFKQPSTQGVIQYVSMRNGGISGQVIWDHVSDYENFNYLTGRGLNPATVRGAASAFVYDLVLDAYDPLSDALYASTNGLWLKVEYTTGTAATGNIVALSEVIGVLD